MTKVGTDHWVELAIAFLLAVATLSTAYSGYQASLWGGVQATSYSQAGAKRTEAARVYNQAGQMRVYDVVVMIEWANAFLEGNQEKADFYQERFRPELGVAFDAWWATDPGSQSDFSGPFQMEEYSLAQKLTPMRLNLRQRCSSKRVGRPTHRATHMCSTQSSWPRSSFSPVSPRDLPGFLCGSPW